MSAPAAAMCPSARARPSLSVDPPVTRTCATAITLCLSTPSRPAPGLAKPTHCITGWPNTTAWPSKEPDMTVLAIYPGVLTSTAGLNPVMTTEPHGFPDQGLQALYLFRENTGTSVADDRGGSAGL